jgi:hypothetical protein
MIRQYRIHPAIGVARIGNSPTEWFDGPEVPTIDFVPPYGAYRDANDLIKRQAVRFRIYECDFEEANPTAPVSVREITDADAEIQWHVHLANLKSFTSDPQTSDNIPQPNDPGITTIAGLNQSRDVIGSVFGVQVPLGQLLTDEAGRLRVLGGFGAAASPSGAPLNGLFNAGWYDDAADGPVRATIRLRGSGEMPPVDAAWVITGVPAYAAPVMDIVTMYDVVYDLAVRHLGLVLPAVSFTNDVFPILQRIVLTQWVSASARQGHGHGQPGDFLDPALFDLLKSDDQTPGSNPRRARERVFRKLRNPSGGAGGNMPALKGSPSPTSPNATGFTVTPTQYEVMSRWSRGDFDADWNGPPVTVPFDQLPPEQQTAALDKATLWTGVGGSFNPGIEVSDMFARIACFERPFRVHSQLRAGTFTKDLSVPWQSDFTACGTGWWPGARPNAVTADGQNFHEWSTFGMSEMVEFWWKLGFLAERTLPNQTKGYLETEVVP